MAPKFFKFLHACGFCGFGYGTVVYATEEWPEMIYKITEKSVHLLIDLKTIVPLLSTPSAIKRRNQKVFNLKLAESPAKISY